MAGYDLELIKLFLESNITVLMVGDPRQVTYHTHEELKNKKYTSGQIEQYISERCKHCSIDVDHSSLNVSHRNHERICTLANQVFSEFTPCSFEEQSTTGHDGVFLVREDDIENYLSIYHPMQLRDKINVTVNPNYPAINFGVSKGLTFNRVLIYPTDTMMKWLIDRSFKLADISRSKLYVALTRARHSVGIVIKAKYIHKCPTDIPLYQSELHHF